MASIKLEGGKELDAALRELGASVATRLGDNSIRAGARVVASAAKAKAPVGKTGNLRKSIRATSDRRKRRSGWCSWSFRGLPRLAG
jgi:Bacteriophage HK97-gp10, putative tail-component